MWGGGSQCVHASLPRRPHTPAATPSLSGAIENRIPPRPIPPSPTLVAQIDSSVACLWFFTPISAGTAVVAVIVAVTTNHWLYTHENILMPYNESGPGIVARYTVSGLWRICYTEAGSSVYKCVDIPFFPLGQYTPDLSDSTNSIPYVVTKSAAPLLLAVFTQAIGALCCVLGHCVKGRRIFTFIAGVMYIVSGLIMLLGIVMYISEFQSQIGHKLSYITALDIPRMSYSYGYSFVLYLSGFIAAELAGTSAIFLFLQWYQKDWITNLTERVNEKCRAWDREYGCTDLRERDPTLLERRMAKRDTYPPSGSTATTPGESRRRINIKTEAEIAHCSMHKDKRLSMCSGSLKDLSSSTLYGFPAAPRQTACEYFEDTKDAPQSANTLSGLRSASIFHSEASVASGRFLDVAQPSTSRAAEEELVTFGFSKKDERQRQNRGVGTEAYRRTTPV